MFEFRRGETMRPLGSCSVQAPSASLRRYDHTSVRQPNLHKDKYMPGGGPSFKHPAVSCASEKLQLLACGSASANRLAQVIKKEDQR